MVSRAAGAEIATASMRTATRSASRGRRRSGRHARRRARAFANVPARREYLRSPAAEFTRIAQWLATMALAYPAVGFTLEHDGTPCSLSHRRRSAPRLRMLRRRRRRCSRCGGDAIAGVSGWISAPGDDRPDRRAKSCSSTGGCCARRCCPAHGRRVPHVRNGRATSVRRAVPDIPPGRVDPNVHPTKSDVRLRLGERVRRGEGRISDCVRRGAASGSNARSRSRRPTRDCGRGRADRLADTYTRGRRCDAADEAALRVLAQVDRTFILATDGEAVVLIDQHAAHERIVFEEARQQRGAHAAGRTAADAVHVRTAARTRASARREPRSARAGGLDVEPFGERAYRIVATPARLAHAGRTRLRRRATSRRPRRRGAGWTRRAVWASLACHSVVRARRDARARGDGDALERLQRAEPDALPARPSDDRAARTRAIARLFKRV